VALDWLWYDDEDPTNTAAYLTPVVNQVWEGGRRREEGGGGRRKEEGEGGKGEESKKQSIQHLHLLLQPRHRLREGRVES
jgi:hypothetical protein